MNPKPFMRYFRVSTTVQGAALTMATRNAITGGLNPGNMEVLEYRRFSSRHLISHSNTASNTVSLSRSRPSPSHLPLPLSIPIPIAFAIAFAFAIAIAIAIAISISISISQFLFLKNEHFWNACDTATYNEGSLLWLQRHSTAFT